MGILITAIVIALIILFLHATTWEGHIFNGIRKVIKPKGMLYKPIYGCPICMTPWWGSLIFWIFVGGNIIEWLFIIFTAAGISVLFVILIALREAAVAYIKKSNETKTNNGS